MGIQLKPGEDIDAYIARRRNELLGVSDVSGSKFADVQSGSSTGPVELDERGGFEKFAHDTYVNRRESQKEQAELIKTDPEAYFKQQGQDATRFMGALGGPATKGVNALKGASSLGRRLIRGRAAGEQVAKKTGIVAAKATPQGLSKGSLASELTELSDEAVDLASVIKGRISTFEDAQAAGAKIWSKASLATKTPDEFGRILKEVPEELMDDFFQGAGAKLAQSVRDMPRLTKSAQASLLSPSGRNVLKHTLRGMDDAEFDKLMIMIERGLWQEARNKILKWSIFLPVLGYVGLRQILPK